MKNYIKFLLIFFSAAASAQTNYSIHGTVTGLPAGKTIMLFVQGKVDSTQSIAGEFRFQGTLAEPATAGIKFTLDGAGYDGHTYFVFLSGQLELQIKPFGPVAGTEVNGRTVYLTEGINDQRSIAVSGNQDAVNYQNLILLPVMESNNRIEKFKMQPPIDSVKLKELVAANYAIPLNYLKTHAGSTLSLVALNMMNKPGKDNPVSLETLAALFAGLPQEVRNSVAGQAYRAKLDRWK